MAQIVTALVRGGQRRAMRELGWNRNVIIKGIKELISSFRCIDNYSSRGRKPVDPTFRTDQNYYPLTAGEVRRGLIDEKNYNEEEFP
jgi:hypothetical protein